VIIFSIMSEWVISDEELGGLHRHCFSCFKQRCNFDGDACPSISCKNGCGHVFHSCKEEEHLLLCPLSLVPCLNQYYGCDQVLPRNQLREHLPSCPASIVACSQEWNRFPLHCKERFKTIPFRQRNPRALRGQLDYELAIRDQDMVGEFVKVPRKTKLALRNNLTRRYPALPLPPHSNRKSDPRDKSLRSLKEAVKFEVGDNAIVGAQYGIAKIFLKNQEKQTKRWQEDVDNAIRRTGQPIPKKYWEYPELERGNIHDHCAYCFDINCEKEFMLTPNDESCCAVHSCSFGCGAKFHLCKSFEHKMICPMFEEESDFDWMNRNRLIKEGISDDKLAELKRTKKKKKKPPPPKPFPDLLTGPTLCLTGPPKVRSGRIPKAPIPPPKDQLTMRFDIKVESVTRLQQKPKAMYTFLCGAEVRRDQWEYHSKNVHSDIHGGLNNWIEARCPLASYGCSFSTRRLYPGSNPDSEIVFSQAVRSFGIKPAPMKQCEKPGTPTSVSVIDLPIEIIQYIFEFLDPFSLSSVSLVSRLLRSVACSLLPSQGCVALQWEREEEGLHGTRKTTWSPAYRRWFFSSYFHPVTKWGFNSDAAVAEHLKVCPYYIRTEHKEQDRKDKNNVQFMKALKQKLKFRNERSMLMNGK